MEAYRIETLVWELTMGCNLRCRHCGSACRQKLEGELTSEEAMEVARQICEMKPRWVALSGGEPLMRNDWDAIAHFLVSNGVEVRMISNGTLITDGIAKRIKNCGISLVSISVDGTEEIHNLVRGNGVFRKVLNAFDSLKRNGVRIGVNTTLMKDNIGMLDEMYQLFSDCGVCSWQLQTGLPEGRLSDHKDLVLDTFEIKKVIDFAYQKNQAQGMKIFLAETIGYFTKNEILARMLALGTEKPVYFSGCNAGIRSLGILHNGDVVGCTSIRKKEFIEGNLRNQSLLEIWTAPDAFAWRRKMKIADLGEKCQRCKYVQKCMGGCTNLRLTVNGKRASDNPLCIYAACKL